MKILFLTRSLDYGGAERQLVLLARGLHQRGHEVAVAVCYPGGPLQAELMDAAVPVLSLDKRGRWDNLSFLVRLIRTVARQQPDILHSYIGNLMTVPVKPFFPTLKIVWSIRSSYIDFSRYDWLLRVSYALTCRLTRWTDLIISNSHAGQQVHVADGYPADRTIVIPNGIDTDRFSPNPAARERMRVQWGVGPDEALVGLVGRVDPMKDHETFLQAAVLLLQERKRVRFVCVGDGPSDYKAALHDRAQVLRLTDHLLWVGAQSQVADVYNALDLLVNCSYGEGFSNVLGEAMACGIPCVATNVGDSGLVIGEFGELVPTKDPVALKTGMQRVLDRTPCATEIRRRIVEHFSVENLVLVSERTLMALCHQPTGRAVTTGPTSLL